MVLSTAQRVLRGYRLVLLACSAPCAFSGCADLLCDRGPASAVTVEVRDSSGDPAAAGARAIFIMSDGVADTGWAAPLNSALNIGVGMNVSAVAKVRVEKPWYEPVELLVRGFHADGCGIVSSKQVSVDLVLLADAPEVRSVYVGRGSWVLYGSITEQLHAVVDAAPGVSDSALWWSSDTTLIVVDPAGVMRSSCVDVAGGAYVGATSAADPAARDSLSVWVRPGSEGCS